MVDSRLEGLEIISVVDISNEYVHNPLNMEKLIV